MFILWYLWIITLNLFLTILGKIGKRQRITKTEAQKWFIDNCEGVVLKGIKKVSKSARRGGFAKKKKAAKKK